MNKKQIVNDPKITSRVDSEIDYRITEPRVNACSVTDCTGAVPVAPQSEEELESYLDVYQFEPESDAEYERKPSSRR